MATDDGPAFEERQSMPTWFGPALVAISVPGLLITAVAVVGTEGITVESIAIVASLAGFVLGPVPLLARARLRTTVRENGVAFRFSPFHRSERTVLFGEIEEIRGSERRAYQHGLRRTRWGWEYRPNAGEGVEIYRENGPPIFLGSERPYDLQAALEEGMRRDRTR